MITGRGIIIGRNQGKTPHDPLTLSATGDTLLGLSTQVLSLDTQAANLLFIGPVSGVATAPTFRALVDADFPATLNLIFAGLTLTGLAGVLKATGGVVAGSTIHADLGSIGENDHHTKFTTIEHTAIGNNSPHHAAVTLGAGAAELTLAGQQLTLAEVLTPTEHIAIGDSSPHHAAVTIGADGEHSLVGQVLSGVDTAAAQKGHIQLAGELEGTATAPTVKATHSGSAHHVAITLAASADTLLGLSTQELSLDTQAANLALVGPASGGAAAPTFRLLVNGDLPVVSVAKGGTGVTALPSFSAHKNGSDQTYTAGSGWVKVTFGTELFDTNSNFASSTFTPSIAGKYLICACIHFVTTNVGKLIGIGLYKNGSAAHYGSMYPTVIATSNDRIFISVVADANGTTDYFEIFAYNGDSVNSTIVGLVENTWFTGSQIS